MKKVLIKENIPNSLSNDRYKKGYLLERDEYKKYMLLLSCEHDRWQKDIEYHIIAIVKGA